MAHTELVLLMLLGLVARGISILPPPCDEEVCGESPSNCTHGISKTWCGCEKCAKGPGDDCGGFDQGCGNGLKCIQRHCPECSSYNPWQLKHTCIHTWTPATNACIRGHNNLVLDGIVSLDDCKARCQAQNSFLCRSVEYHSNSKRCSLSDANSSSIDYIQPCHAKHWWWTFTELNDWTPATNACIRGHNNLILDGIVSLVDCKARCQAQTKFQCRSVEYHDMSKHCILSNATSTRFNEDYGRVYTYDQYNQPCHYSGWTFTEWIGKHYHW